MRLKTRVKAPVELQTGSGGKEKNGFRQAGDRRLSPNNEEKGGSYGPNIVEL